MRRLILVLALCTGALGLTAVQAGAAPPPPITDCNDGIDNEGDDLADYPVDQGCISKNDTNEAGPYDPNDVPLAVGSFELLPEEDVQVTTNSPVTRCKTQRFRHKWTQGGLFDVLTYEGRFRVCYQHGVKIVSVLHRSGDSIFSHWPWTWRGNESGYPFHIRFEKKVEFYYRGTLEFCLVDPGCVSTKHPFVTVTFFDNNTMTRDGGVG
jgi:hypothetical protein